MYDAGQNGIGSVKAAIGIGAMLLAASCTEPGAAIAQYCKPVVPQIFVELEGYGAKLDGQTIHIQYDENGSPPVPEKSFSRNVRTTSCTIRGSVCITSRKRYEMRFDEPGFQSIQVRKIGAKENSFLGGVRWTGAAFPDRVTIRCNLLAKDKHEACRLLEVDHKADPAHSGEDRSLPRMSNHDQCQPAITAE